jgi:hypothetical protein
MSRSPEAKPLKPKPFTSGKFLISFIAILFGSSWSIVREYRCEGSVSGATIGASVTAFVIGLIILVVLGWYANKPEE